MGEVTQWMEDREDWVPDHSDEFIQKISELTVKLAQNDKADIVIPEHVNDLLFVLSYLHTSQALRMISTLSNRVPDISELLTRAALLQCKDRSVLHASSRVMVDRILIVIRLACFETLFGRERRAQVNTLIKEVKNEYT
jgi:flagellar motor switch protein FliG